MANEKRLIEIPSDGIVRIPIMRGADTIGEKRIDLSYIPTVEAVEVVHGRWEIEWEYERDCITGECDETPVATCPFCGHKEYGFAYDEYWGKPYNYCPNCGADMRERKSEDEN